MSKIYKKRTASGFTMVEVMAAMLILSMVCIAYSENLIGAMKLVKATRARDTAIMLASEKMADIDFMVKDKGIEIIKDSDQGEFDQEKFASYTWKSAKKQIPPPDFSSLMSLASSSAEGEEGTDEEQPKTSGSFEGPMKMITDAWGKSVVELRLEVNWKEGEEEKSYSLLTHYISSNATKQIQGLVGSMTGGQ